jgi:uncharacterized protein YozE (UPF0346 family)
MIMTVTNPQTLDVLAEIAQLTYAETTTPSSVGDYVEITQVIDGPLGFQARAFFNDSTNELVIAFAGTEGFDEADLPEVVPDLVTDLSLLAPL